MNERNTVVFVFENMIPFICHFSLTAYFYAKMLKLRS